MVDSDATEKKGNSLCENIQKKTVIKKRLNNKTFNFPYVCAYFIRHFKKYSLPRKYFWASMQGQRYRPLLDSPVLQNVRIFFFRLRTNSEINFSIMLEFRYVEGVGDVIFAELSGLLNVKQRPLPAESAAR